MTETARLIASDGQKGDELGWSVAMSGNTVIAGAPNAPPDGSSPGPGVVYVFLKPPGGWKDTFQTAELSASDGVDGDSLGESTSISKKTVVAGGGDAAYVFVEPKDGWTNMNESAKLTAQGGAEEFGYSVAVSGKTVVAGAPDVAAAYVFGQH